MGLPQHESAELPLLGAYEVNMGMLYMFLERSDLSTSLSICQTSLWRQAQSSSSFTLVYL